MLATFDEWPVQHSYADGDVRGVYRASAEAVIQPILPCSVSFMRTLPTLLLRNTRVCSLSPLPSIDNDK